MRKYYLFILTLVFTSGTLFAQVAGDYRTKDANAYYFWNTSSTWEKYDGSTWAATTDIPGVTTGAITNNVYIRKLTYLRTFITVNATGKIWIVDNGTVTLHIGLGTSISGGISIYGDIDIQSGGNAKLQIWDGSYIRVKPGGKITDNSGGGITNTSATGIILESVSGTENASLITSSSVSGTVEQYISPSRWHLIGVPMSGVTATDFWDGSNDVYLKSYNSPGGGWSGYIMDETTAMNSKEGYEVWETAAFTFNKSGTFNTGNQTLTVASGGSVDPDWNLLANPYPCGIDWAQVSDKTNVVGSTFYVYDGTTYLTHNGTTGTASSSIIPPFTGFFVQYASAGDIALTNSEKAHPGSGNEFYKNTQADTYTNHIKLEADFNGQKAYTLFYQETGATNGKDTQYDAPMLFSESDSYLDVFTFAGDQKTAINIYGEYPYTMEIGFKVPPGGGDITITPTDLRNLDANLLVYLEDKVTGDYINFLENPSYTFTAVEGTSTDRIYLIINNNVGIDDIDKNSVQVYTNKNTLYLNFADHVFDGHLNVYNLLGQNVFTTNVSNNSYHPIYLNQPTGYYFVELISKNESIRQKVFIQQN